MSVIDLKAYTARALELESAIYTQRKMMNEHQNLIQQQRPAAPKRPDLRQPVKPTQPTAVASSGGFNGLMIIIAIPILIGCIAFITALPVLGLIMTAACAYGFYSILSSQSRDNNSAKEAQRKYERDMVEYNHQMEDYHKRYKLASDNYSTMLQNWNVRVDEYDSKSEKITQKHDDALAALEATLQSHYEQNIIFPKYRNMVAIATINEYLMSGRCFELEGPNGAYNLYEMELRQNIIIGQLSTIINSLEQIRNNQFSLYQELVKANATVNDVLQEVRGVRENTRLTAYFAGVTALIEASPKVYIGRTF